MSTYYTCAVCGEPVTFDAPHSCAGAAPTSNLPPREHGLVSLGEMNRRIADAVAEAVAAERRAIVGICNEFMADGRWSEHAHMGARIVRGKILERAI